ncbi:MAG: hypothetical protein FJW39_15825 [Acidobacteria bacterium]|nr:hypothetical protein [Acidobacteriota bacterium]
MENNWSRRSVLAFPFAGLAAATDWDVDITQLTHGPKHHYFGYIGHVRNTPWNGNDRYMALLRVDFQDHMPLPAEAADIVLLDTRDNRIRAIDQSRGWNPQQGTMLYWNPEQPDTQLFFNDRDLKTNRVFVVLYDIAKGKRIREYKFSDTPIGNGGVAQNGRYFLGLNYGRMARLRPVTGYPGAYDWNPATPAPGDDGIFIVEIATGKKRLLVSFRQLADAIAPARPDVAGKQLFINHSLWNRSGDRIYFYARGDFGKQGAINVPFSIRPDGSHLTAHRQFIGGHPEWESGPRIIGSVGNRQVIYDVDKQELVDQIGTPDIFPFPEGDVALSHDGQWFVNGYKRGKENLYTVFRRSDRSFVHTRGLPIDDWSGDLRCDPAPCWNRANNQIAVPAIADDASRTRQTFLLRIRKK